jgi:hypothetical protein
MTNGNSYQGHCKQCSYLTRQMQSQFELGYDPDPWPTLAKLILTPDTYGKKGPRHTGAYLDDLGSTAATALLLIIT